LVYIAEELFVEFEGPQDSDAARQRGIETRVARVGHALDRLFPGPAALLIAVSRPCHGASSLVQWMDEEYLYSVASHRIDVDEIDLLSPSIARSPKEPACNCC